MVDLTMLGRFWLVAVLVWAWALVLPLAEEKGFSWTYAPRSGETIKIALNPYSLGKYLEECQVNRPEVANEVRTLLAEGKHYRKRTVDQKNRGTLLTVYVDNDYMLHVVTYRNDTCPTCKGTGKRKAPIEKITRHVNVNFQCIDCKGTGELKNNTTEKYYILSGEDFDDPELGRRIMGQRAFAKAPDGSEAWVERLASPNPQERMAACLWLDQNYVREGMFFQDIMPMLKKARYYDADNKKKVMVWQFWAGKDLPNERDRTYYRIYAEGKSGKITRKGFYAGR